MLVKWNLFVNLFCCVYVSAKLHKICMASYVDMIGVAICLIFTPWLQFALASRSIKCHNHMDYVPKVKRMGQYFSLAFSVDDSFVVMTGDGYYEHRKKGHGYLFILYLLWMSTFKQLKIKYWSKKKRMSAWYSYIRPSHKCCCCTGKIDHSHKCHYFSCTHTNTCFSLRLLKCSNKIWCITHNHTNIGIKMNRVSQCANHTASHPASQTIQQQNQMDETVKLSSALSFSFSRSQIFYCCYC